RPRRVPDREAGGDPAPRQERDGLPDDGADLRDARADRNADVPRPGLREDLLAAERATADADGLRRQGLEPAEASPVRPAAHPARPVGVLPLEVDGGGSAGLGPFRAARAVAHRRQRVQNYDGAL